MRFESYITLLKNADFIIGNSSSGVREAPTIGIKSINLGSRQFNRSNAMSIINSGLSERKILLSIKKLKNILLKDSFWKKFKTKKFIDIKYK